MTSTQRTEREREKVKKREIGSKMHTTNRRALRKNLLAIERLALDQAAYITQANLWAELCFDRILHLSRRVQKIQKRRVFVKTVAPTTTTTTLTKNALS